MKTEILIRGGLDNDAGESNEWSELHFRKGHFFLKRHGAKELTKLSLRQAVKTFLQIYDSGESTGSGDLTPLLKAVDKIGAEFTRPFSKGIPWRN